MFSAVKDGSRVVYLDLRCSINERWGHRILLNFVYTMTLYRIMVVRPMALCRKDAHVHIVIESSLHNNIVVATGV